MNESEQFDYRIQAHLQVTRAHIAKVIKQGLEDGIIDLDSLEEVLESVGTYCNDLAALVGVDIGYVPSDLYSGQLELSLIVPVPPKKVVKLHTPAEELPRHPNGTWADPMFANYVEDETGFYNPAERNADWAQELDPPLLQPKHPRDMTRDEWIQHFGDPRGWLSRNEGEMR